MPCRLSSLAFFSVFRMALVLVPLVASGLRGDDLVPAAYGIWTDRAGSSWSVEADGNIGRIGSSMVNSGLSLLINDEKFTAHQPMMTPDAEEFVLQGLPLDSLPGLRVQRRIRLLEEPGGIRYAELFQNASAERISITVGLATNFSGNFKTFFSDRGRSEPLLLTESETGIIVLPGTSQSSRAFLFTLTSGGGAVAPTISSQNRYGLQFRYRLDLEPGESGVIVHHVAQVVIPQSFDRRTLLDLSGPYSFNETREVSLSDDWAPHLVNVVRAVPVSPAEAFRTGGLAALGVESGLGDVLALGEGTRLTGRTEGGPVAVDSAYGSASFELPEIGAIAGAGARKPGLGSVYLRDGQIFTGTVRSEALRFIPASGAAIDLSPTKLDRLILAEAAPMSQWPAGTAAIIETREGDRIRVQDEGFTLNLVTAWGILPFALRDLLWLTTPDPDSPGLRVELKNGTRLSGFFAEDTLELGGSAIGALRMPVSGLRSIFTESGWSQERGEETTPVAPYLRVGASDIISGVISETTLPLLVEGTVIDFNLADLRHLARSGEGGLLRCERWDGGTLAGIPRVTSLTMSVGGRTWTIPVAEIDELELAPPALDGERQKQVEQLISRLGSPDWATRESATRELIAFGYLLRPVLQRELAQATDPEVERRLERVLSNLN